MKLQHYLADTRKPGESMEERYKRFGSSLGVTMHAVRKWLYHQRRISDKYKIMIEKRTGGYVTAVELMHDN